MGRYLLMLVMAMVVIVTFGTTFAQEEEEYPEFNYGTVVKIDPSRKEIVVSEYDFENDVEGNVTYSIAPDAEFDGVDSIQDIKNGDEIGIEYIDKGGRRIAKFISIYREEYAPEDIED